MSALNGLVELATPALGAAAHLARLADLLREAGPAASGAVAVLGAVVLTIAGRYPRALAAMGGATVAALAAYALRAPLAVHGGVSLAVALPAAAVVAGAACALAPLAFPVAAGAVPGLLLGLQVPIAGRAAVGGAAGALLAGLVALLFARAVAIGFASAVGGALAAVAAVALGGDRTLARELAAHPVAMVALALVLGIAGAAYQLARGGAPARAPAARDAPQALDG